MDDCAEAAVSPEQGAEPVPVRQRFTHKPGPGAGGQPTVKVVGRPARRSPFRALPWLRAPRVGLSSPFTAVAALALGMVVAFVASGTVFHVSASGSAALENVIGKRCPESTGVAVSRASPQGSALDGSHTRLREVAAEHGLDRSRRSRYAEPVPITSGTEEIYARLITSDGALDHVRPLAGGGAGGAWVPSQLARLHGLNPGDSLTIGPYTTRVAAIYPTITDPVDEYWCSQRSEVIPLRLVGEAPNPPPPIIVSSELMDAAVAAGVPVEDQLLLYPSRPPGDTGEADRLATAAAAVRAEARQMLSSDRINQIWVSRLNTGSATDTAGFPASISRAAQVAVGTSLLLLALISLLVGMCAMVGLASQWLQRRRPEIRLLWIRGATPAELGGKAVLELAGPLAAGTVAGLLVARVTVPALAPAGDLDAWALPAGAVAAAFGLLAGVVVLAVAATVVVRREFQPYRSVRLLRWVPWEAGAAALAVLSWRRLASGALVVNPAEPLNRVDVLALLFPLLCLAVLLGITVRLGGLVLRAGHRLRGWRVPALLWAARRGAAQARLSVALVAAGGLAVGVIAVGVGLAGTERQAVRDKGQMFLGSDAAVQLLNSAGQDTTVPPALQGEATKVAIRGGHVRGDRVGRVLVVDPATLSDGMPWRPEWAGRNVADLVAGLGPPGRDGRVPVIQVGRFGPDEFLFDGLPPMRAVATVPTFPGREHADGMLVMSWDGFATGDRRGFTRYLWTRGDPAAAVAELERSGEQVSRALTAADATDALPFLVVAWTFDFFVTLGLVLAVVAAATLLVAVEARRRAAALATALLRRMGLRTGALYVSHTAELAAVTAVAIGTGLLGAWWVLAVAGRHFDPYPRLTPSPIAASLAPLGLTMMLGGLVAVLLVAVIAVRSALRAPVRELLRG
jgi:putative ABC transport system permease protein